MKDALHSSPKKPRLSWKLHKRRMQLQLLTNFGKELPAPDDTYQQHEQRFLALLQKLLDIRKSLEHYRTKALPEYCAACATLGADVWCVVSADAVGKGVDAERFRHAMCAINETKEMKSHYFNADEVLSGALRFLDIHINAMKSAKSQIELRKHIKLDFDCYDRKVLKLTQRKAASKQLDRNRMKLQQAKDALQAVTFDLYRVFAKYESERDTMLNGELEMVRQVMHGFYSRNSEATDFAIKDEVDRAAMDARTEQIFNSMVKKELELNGNKFLDSVAYAPRVVRPGDQVEAASCVPQPQQLKMDALSCDTSDPSQLSPQLIQPCQSADDELSEKLRTIQLSRPKIPPSRNLKPKFPSNQTEGSFNR